MQVRYINGPKADQEENWPSYKSIGERLVFSVPSKFTDDSSDGRYYSFAYELERLASGEYSGRLSKDQQEFYESLLMKGKI